MPQRGGKAAFAVRTRGGWTWRKRHVALPPQVSAAQDHSRVVYVVRVRNTDSGDWATLVKTGRLASRLSQQALADAIGASRWTILRWEAGAQKPENAEVVARLAKAIRVDYDLLMRAAGLALAGPDAAPKPDPRLVGLDPADPIVQHILGLDISDQRKEWMLNRRRKILDDRRRADLEEVEFLAEVEREEPRSDHRAA